jgi:hypothetical protein
MQLQFLVRYRVIRNEKSKSDEAAVFSKMQSIRNSNDGYVHYSLSLYTLQTSSCSSLHQLNGAGNTRIECKIGGGKGKAYLFIAQTGRYLHI